MSLFSNFDYLFQMSICNWINLFNSLLHSRWLFGGHHKRKWNMYSHSNIPLMIFELFHVNQMFWISLHLLMHIIWNWHIYRGLPHMTCTLSWQHHKHFHKCIEIMMCDFVYIWIFLALPLVTWLYDD